MSADRSAVLVVDDDPSALKATSRIISAAGWSVRSFSSPETFLEFYGSGKSGCIVVMDLRMPGMTGLVVQERLRRMPHPPPIIFITGYADVSTAVAAMRAGAVDFLEKPFSSQQLLERIEKAVDGDREARREHAGRVEVERRLASLTRREREVLDLLLSGQLNRQVATQLGIAVRTVEVHRRNIMRKMHAETGIELARIVLEDGNERGGVGRTRLRAIASHSESG